jgi:hypothetical protein
MRSRGHHHSTDANLSPGPTYAPGSGSAHAIAGVQARRIRGLTGDAATKLWLLPLAIAAAYLVIFVVQLPRNVVELTWDSDYASGFPMAETLAKAGVGTHMYVGSSGQWASLWFGLLTAGLPLHRQLWGIAPPFLFVSTTLIVGWSVAQISDRRSAILAVLIGLVASPMALAFFLAPVAHNTVYPCTALLGAYLVWLTRRSGRRMAVSLVVPPLLGVVAGICLASDLLLASTALIPLALTAVLAGLRRSRDSRLVAASALATIAVAIPISILTSAIMKSQGYLTLVTPSKAAPLTELPERARLLFKGLEVLFNGYLAQPQAPGTLHSELGVASDIVMSAALLALVLVGIRASVKFIASGLRRSSRQEPVELARSLHVIYWFASAATASGVFWIAAETGGGTNLHESYYATVIFSVAAVIPLLLASGKAARVLIATAASIFFASSLVGLTGNYMNIAPWIARAAPKVTKIAEANHVSVGYGGWGESSLTWNTHGRVTLRPAMECSTSAGKGICPFYQAVVASWYAPQPRHTFLLIDREEAWVSSLPEGLGKPLAVYSFGPMRMYIYPYDIASRFGPSED